MAYPTENLLTLSSVAVPLARRGFFYLEPSSKYSEIYLYRLLAIYRLWSADISHWQRHFQPLSTFLLHRHEFLRRAPRKGQRAGFSSSTCALVLLLDV
jgi:hypothetical protein